MQKFYRVNRMIRGIGCVISVTDAQTLNGYGAMLSLVTVVENKYSKWAIFGKQNWR